MENRTILLIDYDSESIQRALSPLIEAGFRVEVARDGVSGLLEFERLKPALVLVEAMLPKKHGFEVCQEIKRTDHGRHTPVVITAAAFRGQRFRSDALQTYGGDEYLEKPIAPEDLVSVCERFLAAEGEVAPGPARPAGASEKPVDGEIPALDEMTDAELDACLDAALLGGTDLPTDTSIENDHRVTLAATISPQCLEG